MLGDSEAVAAMDHKGPTAEYNKRRRVNEGTEDNVANKVLKKSVKEFDKLFNTNNIERIFNLNKYRFNPKPNLLARSRTSSKNSSTSSLVDTMDTGDQEAESNDSNKENDGFKSPKKTRRVPKTNICDKVNTNNRYEPLHTQTQTEEDPSTSGTRTLPPSVVQNGGSVDNRARGKKTSPPIHVMGTPLKSIVSELIKNDINKNKFSIKEVGSNICTIFAVDLEHHKIIINILIKLKWKFYSYTPREEKLKTLVLKGVRGGFDEIDVKTEIEGLNMNEVKITKVSKLTFNRMNKQLHHFIVQLSNDSNKTQLSNVKIILNQRVT